MSHTHGMNHNHGSGNLSAAADGAHEHTYSRPNTSQDDYDGWPIGNGGNIGRNFGNRTTTGGPGNHTHNVSGNTGNASNTSTGGASNTSTGGASNATAAENRNLPPYYALCYIMKT